MGRSGGTGWGSRVVGLTLLFICLVCCILMSTDVKQKIVSLSSSKKFKKIQKNE